MVASTSPLPALDGLPPRSRHLFACGIVAAHLAALAAFVRWTPASPSAPPPAPLIVSLVDAPTRITEPDPLPVPKAPAPPAPQAPWVPLPRIEIAAPEPPISVAPTPLPPAPTPPVTDAAALLPPAPAPAAPPAQPPGPKQVPPRALRYAVEPPIEVPPLSRRLRESGVVVLHVVVNTAGLPRSVTLKRSSGFARLDEQAVDAMRRARFHPCMDNGAPIECTSDATLAYELED
jgi:protein TonB